MVQNPNAREERAARAAALRKQQQRKERRQRNVVVGVSSGVVVLLAAAVATVLVTTREETAAEQEALQAPIEGLLALPEDQLTQNHVPGAVEYPTTPAAGGDHNAVWLNCGVYTEPVVEENVVHSLEHGAVWMTYDPSLPTEQLDQLLTAAEPYDYIVLSPYEGMDSPITLSAWGSQLALEDAGDERIAPFLSQFVQGEQSPEPGAACTGGLTGA